MSESSTELIVADRRAPITKAEPASPNPMTMLALAVKQGADLEKLKQLMDLQERWEKNEARKGFVVAMSEFKSHAIRVVKDKDNTQFDSKYVSLGNLVNTVTPFLSQHGLSVRWEIDQTAGIKVSCVITHIQGHSESVSMIVPPDTSGVSHKTGESTKNPIQQIKSAITYAKACTFESICGLASAEANLDDDGNGADAQWIEDYCSAIQAASDPEECYRIFKEAYLKASTAKHKQAMATFIRVKDARKKELACR